VVVARVPPVDGGALRPCGVGAALELVPHRPLHVAFRVHEEIDHTILQQLVIARSEERGPADILGRGPKDVHHALLGSEVVADILLAAAEVDEVLGEVLVLRSVLLGEPPPKAITDIAERKLPVVMMGEVTPVLLNVHLIGVEGVEMNPAVHIHVHEALQEGQRLLAEVVHLGGAIALHDEHTVQVADVRPPLA